MPPTIAVYRVLVMYNIKIMTMNANAVIVTMAAASPVSVLTTNATNCKSSLTFFTSYKLRFVRRLPLCGIIKVLKPNTTTQPSAEQSGILARGFPAYF